MQPNIVDEHRHKNPQNKILKKNKEEKKEKKDRLAPCTHEAHHWRQVSCRQVNPLHTGDHRVSALIQHGLHE